MGNTRILEIKNESVLLLSKMCLDAYWYHYSTYKQTWKESDLRQWLQDNFMRTAFTEQESLVFVEQRTCSVYNPRSRRSSGPETKDKIFVLSNEETKMYQMQRNQLMAKVTPYAKSRGVYCNADTLTTSWWIRTPGYSSGFQMSVMASGTIDELGEYVCKNNGVRPAVWVDWNKLCKIME